MSRLILVTSITYTVVFFFGWYYSDRNVLVVAAVSCIALMVPLWLVRQRHVILGSWILSVFVLGTLTLLATYGQGYRDISLFAFPVVLLFTSMTLSRSVLIVNVGLMLASICWLILGEMNGWYVPVPSSGTYWADLILLIIIMLVLTYAVHLLTTNMRENLKQAQNEIAERRRVEQEREKLVAGLTSALENIRTLSGLLPICASCKKIRDDQGYWNQLEKYLGDHTDVKLTHGLCPDCTKLYFSEDASPGV